MSRRRSHHDDQFSFIAVGKPGFESLTESYNRLKDNILYLNVDNNTKVIQFVSSISKEGKTTTVCNLAVSLQMNGKKVVVVDCDLRAPRTHRTFKVENEIGLADYMLKNTTYDQIVTKTEEGVDLICRGAKISNASAVLASSKFKALIDELKANYDYVLIDCPPVLEISDYIHVSLVSDACIFCVAHGSTKKVEVKEAINLLKQSSVNVVGSVYTLVDTKNSHGYGYGYGYAYGYGKYGKYGHYGHYGHYGDDQEESQNK